MNEERHWHCMFCGEAVYLGQDCVRKDDHQSEKSGCQFKYAHGRCVTWDAGWMQQVKNP
jgi:hypothetical protein